MNEQVSSCGCGCNYNECDNGCGYTNTSFSNNGCHACGCNSCGYSCGYSNNNTTNWIWWIIIFIIFLYLVNGCGGNIFGF